MNLISHIKNLLCVIIQDLYAISVLSIPGLDVTINDNGNQSFGDMSTNAAMVVAKHAKQNPRVIALQIQAKLLEQGEGVIEAVDIAGPGFLNITISQNAWGKVVSALFNNMHGYFKLTADEKKLRYLIEFVSANPTGPVHLGAGRNGIIGDVLAKTLTFLGHSVDKEYYINDAGSQIGLLGRSLQARCLSLLGQETEVPEGGYVGEYIMELAELCVKEHGKDLINKSEAFFSDYAKTMLLVQIKKTLQEYGIEFDTWFSEQTLHEGGQIEKIFESLKAKEMAYEQDGALWFKSTEFGDDKDRVLRKTSGEVTYIAPDIAYHKNKFDRGYDRLIDILGQDHHGYIKRLKATMEALGYPADHLDVILYQLVSIKIDDEFVKMSKRAGTFTKLQDILDTVGPDVARFFYLNRKADAHLEFDLTTALKKTDENPVFYLQYAYVRASSLIVKAGNDSIFADYVSLLQQNKLDETVLFGLGENEYNVVKKILSFHSLIRAVSQSYQTHLLAYYALELAHTFHNYYANNRIINSDEVQTTKVRLLMTILVKDALKMCLNLLGVSCPEKM